MSDTPYLPVVLIDGQEIPCANYVQACDALDLRRKAEGSAGFLQREIRPGVWLVMRADDMQPEELVALEAAKRAKIEAAFRNADPASITMHVRERRDDE